jgi:hypothetical protein
MSESGAQWRDELERESKNREMKGKNRQEMGDIEGKSARKAMRLSSEKHACPTVAVGAGACTLDDAVCGSSRGRRTGADPTVRGCKSTLT